MPFTVGVPFGTKSLS